jgi:hypothetical protein
VKNKVLVTFFQSRKSADGMRLSDLRGAMEVTR